MGVIANDKESAMMFARKPEPTMQQLLDAMRIGNEPQVQPQPIEIPQPPKEIFPRPSKPMSFQVELMEAWQQA